MMVVGVGVRKIWRIPDVVQILFKCGKSLFLSTLSILLALNNPNLSINFTHILSLVVSGRTLYKLIVP
ncbi:hypothetical protein LWI28_024705 [Acer negundo]|uniref:Uncharacterized protein n=1 Tax=Acer negundo TaxID=4023 RepID=A0AAD5IH13_ACENE|nr:hypothetical protein LWI28_024705 [Acer negundo]